MVSKAFNKSIKTASILHVYQIYIDYSDIYGTYWFFKDVELWNIKIKVGYLADFHVYLIVYGTCLPRLNYCQF